MIITSTVVGVNVSENVFVSGEFISRRPKKKERKFISEAVESTIKKVKDSIIDEELA